MIDELIKSSSEIDSDDQHALYWKPGKIKNEGLIESVDPVEGKLTLKSHLQEFYDYMVVNS